MESFKIRKAEKKDVGQMFELIKELAEFEHGLNEVTINEENLLKHGFSDNPLFHCLVAELDHEILGMALYFYTYSTWNGRCLYLEDLVVKRALRIRGVGTALMNELIAIGKAENVARISWQVLDWNLDAHDFYKKFDASLDGTWLNGRLTKEQIKSFLPK